MKSAKAKIGVMGGMFDPVHQGHLTTAVRAQQEFGLHKVHMVPCGSPVHRQAASASDQERIEMLNLATAGFPGLVVDERECNSSASSYTFNTLDAISAENPDADVFYILGLDSFISLPAWYRWQDLLKLVHLLVITRPGWGLEELPPALVEELETRRVNTYTAMCDERAGRVLIAPLKPLAISSSEVRRLLLTNENQAVNELLPAGVLNYIMSHKLYGVTGV